MSLKALRWATGESESFGRTATDQSAVRFFRNSRAGDRYQGPVTYVSRPVPLFAKLTASAEISEMWYIFGPIDSIKSISRK